MGQRLAAVLLSAALLGLALVLVACGSDSSNQSSSPSPSATSSSPTADSLVCSSLKALSSDVKTMTSANSLTEFQDGFTAAKQDFAQLKPAATAAYGPQVDAVQRALDKLGEELQSAGQGGAGASLQRIGTAAAELGAAVQQLTSSLPCPSGSG